jgi:RNA recognition motif-containing protein
MIFCLQTESSKVVFAGNLSWTTSDEDLLNYVGGAGKVVKATVQRHADTGRSKGWG